MKSQTPVRIKRQIEILSKDFNLKYNSKWFDFIWISVRHEILTEYLGDCWDSVYKKYGKTIKRRIKNLDKFVNSDDFKECLKRYGGQVFDFKGIKEDIKSVRLIENINLRKELLDFYMGVLGELKDKNLNNIAGVTIPRNEKERTWQINYCLREEWMHNLMKYNRLWYQNKDRRYWIYDEGIVTYFAYYLDKKLNKLEEDKNKKNISNERKYYLYAIKFRDLLKNAETPKERKSILKKFYRDLK